MNDFAIGLQTPLQADILKQFSLDSVICVDSTHGTNGYNFNLITIIVVDEYGEGYPVAWCVSNREDQVLLQVFYNSIKKKVGMLSHNFFMSDLAEQFFLFSLDSSILQHQATKQTDLHMARGSCLEGKPEKVFQ